MPSSKPPTPASPITLTAMPIRDVALFALSVLAGALAVSVGTKLVVAVVAVPHLVATAFRLWMLRSAIDR